MAVSFSKIFEEIIADLIFFPRRRSWAKDHLVCLAIYKDFSKLMNRYHDPPKYAEDMPDFRVMETNFDAGYSSASFVCYACNKWDGNRLDTGAETQPWVWATNDFQDPDSDDPNKKLGRHNYYGKPMKSQGKLKLI